VGNSTRAIPARVTGIYRTPPQQFVDVRYDPKAFREHAERADREIFDLDAWLTKIQKFAQDVIDCYEDRSGPRIGYPLPPDKSKGIPHNVKEQLDEALTLRVYLQDLHQALDKGNLREAALHGFWVGKYYEALRVRKVEYVAMRGRKNIDATRKGHAKKYGTVEQKQQRWAKYQKDLNALAKHSPHRSFTALRQDVADMNRVSFKTIERHTVDPRPHHE
jgi:hypothetical protein